VADSTVKFFDAHVRPPRGGWTFTIAGRKVEKHSESEVISELRKWRQNNNTYVDDESLSREVWGYYCSREPERCGQSASNVSPTAIVPKDLTPEVVGPIIWKHLNLSAARWNPGLREWFLSYLDIISVLIECPVCQNEWRSIVSEKSPVTLNSRLSVCQWVNWAHNRVNSKRGKSQFSYERMVIEYGAPAA